MCEPVSATLGVLSAASGAASAIPVQSVAGATGAVAASTISSAGNIVVQGDNISSLTNNSGFTDFDANDVQNAITNNVTTIDGGKITTGTVNSARINTDTLNVKQFDDVTSKIINHNDNKVPLTRFASNYTTTANTGTSGTHTCVPVDVTQCRTGGSFIAYVQGIFGDVENVVVEFSVNGGTSYSTCANGVQFSINAGTFRPYTLIYSDTLTFSGSNQTAIFRVRFNGKANYTQLGLTVLVDNTN